MSVIPSIILSAVLSCGSCPREVGDLVNTFENGGCENITNAAGSEILKNALCDVYIDGCPAAELLKEYLDCRGPAAPEETPPPEPENTPVPPTEAPAMPTKAPITPTKAPITPTKAPITPTKAPVTPTNTPPQDSSSYAYRVIELVNAERAKYGLPALSADGTLMSAAQKRAAETAVSFSHTRPDGSSFSSVLSEYGYNYRSAGENIAYGQRTPEDVVNAWMNSSGHRANILKESYTKIGVGCHKSGGTYYWSQLFAG